MQSNQAAHNRQAEPGATVLPVDTVFGLLKAFEDLLLFLDRDSNASIAHENFDGLWGPGFVGRSTGDQPRPNHHFAFVGKFNRVAGQVQKDLLQAIFIRIHER